MAGLLKRRMWAVVLVLLLAVALGVVVSLGHTLGYQDDQAVMREGYVDCYRSMGGTTGMEIVETIETCAAQWGVTLTENDYP